MHVLMTLEGPTLVNSRTFATTTNQLCIISTATMYGNDTQLSECEVYKVEQSKPIIRFLF